MHTFEFRLKRKPYTPNPEPITLAYAKHTYGHKTLIWDTKHSFGITLAYTKHSFGTQNIHLGHKTYI